MKISLVRPLIPPNWKSIALPFFLLPLLLFLTSCANTTYIPVENGKRTVGKGAILRNVNGIDIWSDGQPPRPYQIIGVIHDRRNGLRKGALFKDLAKEAKRRKADAILAYQAYGATAGGATAGAASAAQSTLMLGALASGPAITFLGPVAAGVAATAGGASRWWVAKYLPEKPKATAAEKQPRPPLPPHPASTAATPHLSVPQGSAAPSIE
ncbi:hypothetical protein [Methylacidimicrobium tartarophylax]|uniref:Lipoprotein n=1 Tax=Methylacidimicrobium tartarophylax TaxID=1041768 RepID=A0A5E6MA15_9BACT|nr:hypothetical protein [Methylacidimicrobium tartarophylax]VVM05809.1 hypothetical protein MAMT_00810 [Methylacidimicrobium tartarophylax]